MRGAMNSAKVRGGRSEATSRQPITSVPKLYPTPLSTHSYLNTYGRSSQATCLCVLSLEDEHMHNVRSFALFYDDTDMDSSTAPTKIIASDFAGVIAFWDVEQVRQSKERRKSGAKRHRKQHAAAYPQTNNLLLIASLLAPTGPRHSAWTKARNDQIVYLSDCR